MKIISIIIVFFISIQANFVAAQSYSFTLVENEQYKTYLDSLKRLSYLQDALLANVNMETKMVADEVYAERLAKINSLIKLTFNAKVKAFIQFYVETKRPETQLLLGLSNYYLPSFEASLRKYQLPLEFKYLPIAESGLFPRAFSSNGASGIWQLTYTTGKRYNLLISSLTDERRNTSKATDVAAQYLRELWDIYNDWTLVLAAYNCGPTNVNKAIARANGERDFWKIYDYLPLECREIVGAYIAVVYISNYYTEHNLVPSTINIPTFWEEIKVEKKLHFGQISNVLHVPMAQLRDMNPEYKKDIVSPLESRNTVLVSPETKKMFMVNKDSIYSFNMETYFQPENVLVIKPIASSKNATVRNQGTQANNVNNATNSQPEATDAAEAPEIAGKTKIVYSVKSGESLGLIAQKFRCTVSQLQSWNNLYSNRIHVGQTLAVYVTKGQEAKYATSAPQTGNAPTVVKQTTKTENTNTQTTSTNVVINPFANVSTDKAEFVYYTVKSGDNLWLIAKRYPGTTTDALMQLNGLTAKSKLQPGMVLKVKKLK